MIPSFFALRGASPKGGDLSELIAVVALVMLGVVVVIMGVWLVGVAVCWWRDVTATARFRQVQRDALTRTW